MEERRKGIFHDLCASSVALELNTMHERLSTCCQLGFSVVCFGHRTDTNLSDKDRCSIKPIEVTTSATGLSAVRRAVASCKEKCAEGGTESSKTTAAAAGDRGASRVRQLSRITIFGDDVQACQSAVSKSAILSGYDVLAIEPQSERVFGAACTSLDVDVISLDLTKRLPYRLKSTAVKAALARGVFFEVCYAPALRDPGARRQFFSNVQSLSRETRGNNLVLSSNPRNVGELRGPYDVVNLGKFLGLTQTQAHAAVTRNPAALLERSIQRRSYRGTLVVHPINPATHKQRAKQQHPGAPSKRKLVSSLTHGDETEGRQKALSEGAEIPA